MKQIEDREAIDRLSECLTWRERRVIEESFGLDGGAVSMREISDDLEVCRGRVQQIREKALRKMRVVGKAV